MFIQILSVSHSAEGFYFIVLLSTTAPAFKNNDVSSEFNFLSVIKILKQIINRKVILSRSKSPQFTYLYTLYDKSFKIYSTSFIGSVVFGELSIDALYKERN